MKRLLITVLAVGMFGLAGTANAQLTEDVVNSKHNLSASGGTFGNSIFTNDTDRVCVFCHSPHTQAGAVEAPLWNRSLSTATYQMYTSPTMDMELAPSGQPEGVSQACLSCHDGTVAFDSLVNLPGSGGFTAGGAQPTPAWTFVAGSTMPAGITLVGPDLRATHPISVTYNRALDPQFNTVADVEAGGVKLFGTTTPNQVECASCHNPHEGTNPTFLRVPNTDSGLCTTCHIK